MNTKFEVIFDTETKKFFDEATGYDASKLGVSITSVYSRTLDENFNEIGHVSGRNQFAGQLWLIVIGQQLLIGRGHRWCAGCLRKACQHNQHQPDQWRAHSAGRGPDRS